MNLKKFFVGMAALVLACAFVISCSMPDMDEAVNESRSTEVMLRFSGGSLALDNGLVPGASALVRLGTIEATETGFADKGIDAHFGLLRVNSVNTQVLTFDFAALNVDGTYGTTVPYSLNLGDRADLNGDGIPDLIFEKNNDVPHLFFVSSPNDLRTTTFTTLDKNQEELFLAGIASISMEGNVAIGFQEEVIAQINEEESLTISRVDIVDVAKVVIAVVIIVVVAVAAH